MSLEEKNRKSLAHLIMGELDAISSSDDAAKQYANDEGLDFDSIRSEGLKRMKQLRLKLKAKEKLETDEARIPLKEKARELVNNLLQDPSFSLLSFMNQNEIALHNRSIDSFTDEDIRNTLEQFYYMKMSKEDKKDQ